uniref:Cyclase family protein n=1 Tax=Moniliophthora roreri TaxID=221103 RepID=A0A0W0GDE6_MONRR
MGICSIRCPMYPTALQQPLFGRKTPEVIMKPRAGRPGRDDEININTQSGSQWDGLRHFGLMDHGVFYNDIHMDTMSGGVIPIADPKNIDPALARIGIQKWAEHGISGRGVLVDLVRYYATNPDGGPERQLPYDPWSTHPITVKEIETVAAHQGVKFRQGDILILRVGFIKKYHESTQNERDALVSRPEQFAGIEQSDEMKRFLWNNHFAAVASDQPALERWPTPEGTPHMHQTILGLWGMPIGG